VDDRAAQAARTREVIIAATTAVALERGFTRLRVADVAAAAGVSTGLVHYHFATKDALVAEALRAAAAADLSALDAALVDVVSSRARLERFLAAYGPEPGGVGWPLWIDAWSLALRSPALAAILGDLEGAWRSRLVTILEQGAAEGALRCAAPEQAAEELLALGTGLAVRVVVGGLDGSAAAARLRSAAARLLGTSGG
jgi:AcrR family transcriptional regulator